MIRVRPAVASDVPWLLAQLRQFAEFFGSARSLFPDDVTAVEKLTTLMDPDVGCFLIATFRDLYGTDLPLGFIAGVLTPHFFNPSIRVLSEVLWWVTPEHRGGRAGITLLNAYEMYARDAGADWVTMTLEEKSPVNPTALTKRGFRLYESSYLKELPTAAALAEDDRKWAETFARTQGQLERLADKALDSCAGAPWRR